MDCMPACGAGWGWGVEREWRKQRKGGDRVVSRPCCIALPPLACRWAVYVGVVAGWLVD